MMTALHESISFNPARLSRRRFLHTVSAASLAAGTLSFSDLMSLQAAELRKQHRAVIMLWMAGAPSQFETFDPKPGHENGGGTEVIDTTIPGVQFAKGWENTAKSMNDFALIRSMTNKEGNHRRASYQLHTGYIPAGSLKHPSLAANIAREIADPSFDLPSVVSIGRGFEAGSGYLDVSLDPFFVDRPGTPPANMTVLTPPTRYERRLGLLSQLEQNFAGKGAGQLVEDHQKIYSKTSDLVLSPKTEVFELDDEPQSLKDKYGDSEFGRGCLLARRLVESGVSYVEVRVNGWDTHDNNHARVSQLAQSVDPATAALVADLKDRGMHDSTLVVWMGEFGRTPKINGRAGRDHFPKAWSMLMAGAGVKGGQVIGATNDSGDDIKDTPITVPDLFTSICQAVKVNPLVETMSPQGRPLKIVDGGTVIPGLFA